jgi:multiple sugar transport system substrate-binding protein
VTRRLQRSPSPTQVGYLLSRRRFIAGGAALLGTGGLLAACGDDDTGTTGEPSGGEGADPAELGTVTFGSNYSDEKPKEALVAAIATTGLEVTINTVDHNTYQENFNTYIQQPDDVVSWFAGYRMRAFASKGVVSDISDVWEGFTGFSDGLRNASTGLDGNQYFVPFYYYAWGIHYRKSLFEANNYTIPETWDDFIALCDTMQADGLTPLCAANDGRWPQMGTFDMLNLRVNGYDYHVSLMGGNEDWTSQEVKEVFTYWNDLLPYYQPDANGRTWQDAANALGDQSAGMFLLGNFVTSNFDAETQQDIIDDIDFFLFPEINAEHGRDAIEAPIDGFMLAASPANEAGAKALLGAFGGIESVEAFVAVDPSFVAANGEAETSAYSPLQLKAAELVSQSAYVAQFLDRDTDPDFAANVVGTALADYLASPGDIDSILSIVEEQKATYTFE